MTRIIERVLSEYFARSRSVTVQPLGSGGGFSGARIVRVRTADGDFCLRGWPTDGPPMQRILGLHRLLQSVFNDGVRQVAVPIAAKTGSTLVRAQGRYWQLEPWMPGRADFWENPNEDRLRAVMRCLAGWHRAAATFRPQRGERRWFATQANVPSPAVHERLQLLQQWEAGHAGLLKRSLARSEPTELRDLARHIWKLFERVGPAIKIQLQTASQQPVSLQPCLRDVWHDHILFRGDNVTGMIDPTACRSENVTADLARLLGSLLGDDRESWETALNAYEHQRPLSPEERTLVPVLDHSGVLLSALSWLDRLYVQGEPWSDARRVCERLQRFASRLQHLSKRV